MFDRLLIPLDGSQTAQCVLPAALGLAVQFDAQVELIHVLCESDTDASTQVDPLQWHMRKAEVETYLSFISQAFSQYDIPTKRFILEGAAAERIISHARIRDIDLIILSSHGLNGLSGWNVSSVAQKIVARANRSIMLVRAFQPGFAVTEEIEMSRFRRLLVPLDGSRRAEGVLPIANKLALAHDATVHLVHVARPSLVGRPFATGEEQPAPQPEAAQQYQKAAADYLQGVQTQLECDTKTAVLPGDSVISTLNKFATREAIDLMMLSAHGRANTQQAYGSIATSAIMHGAISLFIFQDLAPDEIEPTHAEMATDQNTNANSTRTSQHAQPAFWSH